MKKIINWIAKKLGFVRISDIMNIDIQVTEVGRYMSYPEMRSIRYIKDEYQRMYADERKRESKFWEECIIEAEQKGKYLHKMRMLEKEADRLENFLSNRKADIAKTMISQYEYSILPYSAREWIDSLFLSEVKR